MNEIIIKGLADGQMLRLAESSGKIQSKTYFDVRCVILIPTKNQTTRMIFDGMDEWNHEFQGTASDVFRILSKG
jgi:hypothetical protein